jgi:hypothetical protein
MAVHAIAWLAPVLDKTAHQCEPDGTLPVEAGDAEWVADLLATFRAGDLEADVSSLDRLLTLMREATRARRTPSRTRSHRRGVLVGQLVARSSKLPMPCGVLRAHRLRPGQLGQ